MLQANYAHAVEKRLQWIRWAAEQADVQWNDIANLQKKRNLAKHMAVKHGQSLPEWLETLPVYKQVLESGDSFFMNRHFCELVEHARKTVPNDMQFDHKWLQSPCGWLWIEQPFNVPQRIDVGDAQDELVQDAKKLGEEFGNATGSVLEVKTPLRIHAVGWVRIPEGANTQSRVAGPGATMFLTYQDFSTIVEGSMGFGCWSYFMLQDGDVLSERVRYFEEISRYKGGMYADRSEDVMHEIRWVYAAMFLMSQRLQKTVIHPVDRHTKKRAAKQNIPQPPIIRVISLRRMEQERPKGAAQPVDWQWQWEVRGHWRNQFCPGSGEHKPVFIEAYIKGPEGKPLKPPGLKLFVARR